MQQILMGNEAIALGLIHANVDVISGYPGTPSSEILTNYQKLRDKMGLKAYAQWASNEKVGYEVAYAHAMSGKNACATMKTANIKLSLLGLNPSMASMTPGGRMPEKNV